MGAPNSIKRAALAFTAQGDNTVIAAVTDHPLHIWKIAITTHAAEIVAFYDGASASGTLLGTFEFTAAGSLVLDGPEGFPLYDTSPGNGFVAKLTTGVAIKGTAWYSVG